MTLRREAEKAVSVNKGRLTLKHKDTVHKKEGAQWRISGNHWVKTLLTVDAAGKKKSSFSPPQMLIGVYCV